MFLLREKTMKFRFQKKIGALLACLAVMPTGLTGVLCASAEDDTTTFTDNTLTYTKVYGGVEVSDCEKSVSTLTIPQEIDGFPILGIADEAFLNCGGLTSLTINAKLKSIGNYAFSGCSALKEITFPDSLETIGDCAFYYCTQLEKISLGKNLTDIGDYAFGYCIALSDVTMADEITALPQGMFYFDISMTELNLPKKLESIGAQCFMGCDLLEEVTIPASLRELQPTAFLSCSSIQKFNVEDENTTFSEGENGSLLSEEGKTLVLYPAGNGETVCQIPEGIVSIEPYAFAGSPTLTSVTLPQSFKGNLLPEGLFSDCTALVGVGCDESALSAIMPRVFAGCKSLKTLDIPENCSGIGDYAFYGCEAITEFDVPETVEYLGAYAFFGCDNLNELTVPKGIQVIGDYAVGFTEPVDGESEENVLLRKNFVLHGDSASVAKKYADSMGVDFKRTNFNFPLLFAIVGGVAGILAVLLLISLLRKAKKNADAKKTIEQEEVVDENYESILESSDDETEGDPFDRSYGFTVEDEDDAENDTEE